MLVKFVLKSLGLFCISSWILFSPIKLSYGLKPGITVHHKELEMIAIIQDVYDQILRHYETKNNYFSNKRFKTTLKAFTFNYLDIDDKRYIHDKKYVDVLQKHVYVCYT